MRAHLHRDRPPPLWEGARIQSAFMSHVHAACMQHACSRICTAMPTNACVAHCVAAQVRGRQAWERACDCVRRE